MSPGRHGEPHEEERPQFDREGIDELRRHIAQSKEKRRKLPALRSLRGRRLIREMRKANGEELLWLMEPHLDKTVGSERVEIRPGLHLLSRRRFERGDRGQVFVLSLAYQHQPWWRRWLGIGPKQHTVVVNSRGEIISRP